MKKLRGDSLVIPAGEECGEVLQNVGACPVVTAAAHRLGGQCLEVCCGRCFNPVVGPGVGPLESVFQTGASVVLNVLVGRGRKGCAGLSD